MAKSRRPQPRKWVTPTISVRYVRLCPLAIALLAFLGACDSEPSDPAEPNEPSQSRRIATPDGWFAWLGEEPVSYEVGLDDGTPRSGGAAAYLRSTRAAPSDFATLTQSVRADDYRGHCLRWTGWIRHTEVEGDGAALWMRVDGPGATMAFDNMSERRLLRTSDWQEASVVLDVPEDAIGIAFGVLLAGPGDVIVDDLRFEVVDSDVASTDMLESPTPTEADSAAVAGQYETVPSTPVNLDFEGIAGLSDATVDFLRRTAIGFADVEPTASDEDLEPLREMVGDARVVALGEGTHGTREFFQLKHRVFQFLVREMGFTRFAIEATWLDPAQEANYFIPHAFPHDFDLLMYVEETTPSVLLPFSY